MADFVAIATWVFGQTAVKAAAALLADGKPALDAAVAGGQAVEDDPTVALGRLRRPGQRDRHGAAGRLRHGRQDAGLRRRGGHGEYPARRGRGSPGDGEDAARPAGRRRGAAVRGAGRLSTGDAADGRQRGRVGEETAQAEGAGQAAGAAAGPRHRGGAGLDKKGSLGGVCTTSGLPFKLPGRVGDSPLIGSGLYVDNEAGAAGATGVGEEIIRINGSHFIVEAMRAGKSPQEACELAIRKVNAVAVRRGVHPAQVSFLALDTKGRIGAACTAMTNFQYAVARGDKVELLKALEIGPEGE